MALPAIERSAQLAGGRATRPASGRSARPLVDVHCHILPCLDDGALDLGDSVRMARQGWEDGIAVVCATPHIRDDHDVRIDELPSRLSALSAELAAAELPIHVVSGAEVSERAAQRLDAATLRRLTLGGGDWLLIEPAPGPLGDGLQALVGRLWRDGLRVAIAHPERHAGADFEPRLRRLVDEGCLIQWTADFVSRADEAALTADEAALTYAAKGLLHLLGSDAHSSHGGRPLKLSAGLRRLAEVRGSDDVAWIATEAPWGVLRGGDVTPPW